jgi:mono/diheme cytochrome c family protein
VITQQRRISSPAAVSGKSRRGPSSPLLAAVAVAVLLAGACADERSTGPLSRTDPGVLPGPSEELGGGTLVSQGRGIFRFDTYGDETFWTDTLRMHEVIRSSVSPATALAVGLKVDVDALPGALRDALRAGKLNLNDPANTVALLKLGAVLGVRGEVDARNTLTRVGVTCALCHSTVDDAFAPGIGHRLDGWPNRTLNVGAIIALSPALTAAQKAVYNSWGPGKYDPRFNIDGKNIPAVIPPAFGLRHVAREIYTGDDTISYWNAYVAITQMHGHGHFSDPRLGIDVLNPPELVAPKLAALRAYQFSLATPAALSGTYDPLAAQRGRALFAGRAGCAECHQGSVLTDVNRGVLHTPASVGQDPAYALRSVTKLYRTTPLRGLWHPPQLTGPYFHDGNARTLDAVVEHYVRLRGLDLTAQQRHDLVEYLKSL